MALVKRRPTSSQDCPGPVDPVADLSSNSIEVRRRAARALAGQRDAGHALCERLAIEADPSVREAILTSLLLVNTDEAVRGLIPLLRVEDAALRNAVLEALQEMPESVGPYVRSLLKAPEPDVRIFAVDLLQVLRHPDAPACLAEVIASESHVNVCAAAVDRLAELGTPEVVPALRALAERFSDEPFIQFATAVAIQRIQGGQDAWR